MKDYRPLLSNVLCLLELLQDNWDNVLASKIGSAYSVDEVESLIEDTTEMFNELDMEYEGGARF